MNKIKLYQGNALLTLKSLADNSIDCGVTDPPYELNFMGKKWDNTGIAYSIELWREVWRVLKPGGYLLSFGGSRTYHRMACAIEDAGFEVRDQIMWVYGSGFPKSLDVSKAIDKAAGAEREITGVSFRSEGRSFADGASGFAKGEILLKNKPVTDAAKQWQGWGTSLKPAHEPICVARKPLIGTVADNVLTYGTGAINIDGCRVGFIDAKDLASATWGRGTNIIGGNYVGSTVTSGTNNIEANPGGRWPANFIHDGSEEVLAGFPDTAPSKHSLRNKAGVDKAGKNAYRSLQNHDDYFAGHNDNGGSAARFFYCAKASKVDRGEGNNHPTVKPTDLMRYLVRLVCPPGGVCLDPFEGSGSTGKACAIEGFDHIGIDLEPAHLRIQYDRISAITPCTIIADGVEIPREAHDLIY
jgi:site-specific DNA-methyltransferase (adenine-specific)